MLHHQVSLSLQGQRSSKDLTFCFAKLQSEKLELARVKSEGLRFGKAKAVKGVNGVKQGLASQ